MALLKRGGGSLIYEQVALKKRSLHPGIIALIVALLIALKGLETSVHTDEKNLKNALSASWQEEKTLRISVKEKLKEFTLQKPIRSPLPQTIQSTPSLPQTATAPIRRFGQGANHQHHIVGSGQRSLAEAIRTGDLRTAGKLDKNRDGVADSLQPTDIDGDGVSDSAEYKEGLVQFHVKQTNIHTRNVVLKLWDDAKTRAIAKGKKDGGILDYAVTEHLLKKGHLAIEIKNAFKSANREIPKGVIRCLSDAKRSIEDEFSETETYR